jgi:dipeptidyl aminopeptidase/acylaminoacyl peptidase
MIDKLVPTLAALALVPALGAQAPTALSRSAPPRSFSLDDVLRVRDVREPQISPDGAWVAYTVSTSDTAEDRNKSAVWMASWDGARNVRLTTSKQGEDTPRWSPDGRWLAFLSSRDDEHEHTQLWLLDRLGGEGRKATTLPSDVDDYVWAPDGKRIALVVADADTAKPKTPAPIVIDRFQFKQDEAGYLGKRRRHLHVLDVESGKTTMLTSGDYDELLPAWSPDGKALAFVSKRRPDFDRDSNWDLYVIDAAPGGSATPRQLTTFEGPDNDPETESRPAWSPDGRSIAYLQGGPLKLIYYAVQKLAVVPAAGGAPRILTAALDRNVGSPVWSSDGSSITFLLEDDRAVGLARVPAAGGGAIERLVSGSRVVSAFAAGANGRLAVLASTPLAPAEVFALDGTTLRPLSRQNDEWLSRVKLGAVEPITFKSLDGTAINGFVVKPPDFASGKRYPTILRIHGGPVSQYQHEFDFQLQTLAGHGYLVVVANPRGSSGRGERFSAAIFADWGNKDAQDVLAAVDYAVAQGLADPARLGVGGWSYGGILTNYVIAQDHRFKAAVSGASISNVLAGYGTDQYVREYEGELGVPWKAADTWVRLSSPFLHADRINTPTLFLCGDKDFNVPLLNSEQMYQALRSLGVETQLVIYPGQHHAINKPSYRRDRLARYLVWYDKYLKP